MRQCAVLGVALFYISMVPISSPWLMSGTGSDLEFLYRAVHSSYLEFWGIRADLEPTRLI